MGDKDHERNKGVTISSKGRMFLVAWTVCLLILSALGGYIVADHFNNEISGREQKSGYEQNGTEYSIGKLVNESAISEPNNVAQNSSNATKVLTGIYIDRIPSLSIKDSVWETEFYIWFSWNGSRNIDPGENLQVINGEIKSKLLEENLTSGQARYEEYRIIANINKVFDVTRFPLDSDQLTLEFEDNFNSTNTLVYVPDISGTKVNPSIIIPGYEITNLSITERPHYYTTNFGNPNRRDNEIGYSRLSFNIGIVRPGWGWFFKIFQGLFLAVAISMLVFFIRPNDGDKRVSLAVGAAFAAVANFYISSSMMPETDMMTLADMINGIGIIFVFFSLVQSTISLHLYDQMNEVELSRLFDWISAGIFFVSYIGINLALVLTAR
jgi:hypothetical protein